MNKKDVKQVKDVKDDKGGKDVKGVKDVKGRASAPADLPHAFSAVLACGCRLAFRPGTDESPVLVVIERKGDACNVSLHVGGLPVYDRRSALRPPTRFGPPLQPDFEDG